MVTIRTITAWWVSPRWYRVKVSTGLPEPNQRAKALPVPRRKTPTLGILGPLSVAKVLMASTIVPSPPPANTVGYSRSTQARSASSA